MATTSVTQRNIELARKAYAAFDEADMAAVMATIADDCLWHAGPLGSLAGDHKGKAAVGEFFMKFGQLTQGNYKVEIHDILADEEHTVVLGTTTITKDGKTRHDRFVDIVHPNADGQVREFWRFVEDPQGLVDLLDR
jgi:ketosteroid isomerase-like protein